MYNEMLSTISTCLHDNNVVNCIIAGDLNTDLSRVRSGNTISINNFIANESLSVVQQHVNILFWDAIKVNLLLTILLFLKISKDMSKSIVLKSQLIICQIMSRYIMLLECTIVDVSLEQDIISKEKSIWNLAKQKHILEYQGQLNELLHQIDFSNNIKLCNKCNVMCFMKSRTTDFHDKIIDACCAATESHIPYGGQLRPKVIPGWDTGMDIARNSSLFWNNIWPECEKPDSRIVYNIMKTNRNTNHYKLRKIKRLKQSKIKDSISRCMLRSNKRNYWRSARAVRKNNYNSALTVDGIHGTSEIANHFKTKFSRLYSSVPTSEETVDAIAENIDIDIQK